MKIKRIKIKDFKGLHDVTYDFNNLVTVVSGPVGTGKTSFLQALRFGLTNETPPNPISNGAISTNVILECDEDIIIEREITKPNKKFTKIMGRKTGTSASESFLEETTNVSTDIMKIASSSDVLAEMKPAQFGAIFLNESVEKKSLSDLMDIFVKSTTKEKKAIMFGFEEEEREDKLPPDVVSEIKALFKAKTFNLDAINKAYEEAKAIRRDRNAMYKISASKSKGFLEIVKPEYSESDLNKQYEEIIGVEKNVKAYKAQVEAYDKMSKSQKQQEKRISELNLAITMNRAVEPDKEALDQLIDKKNVTNREIVEQSRVSQTLLDNKKWFENTLAKLDKPVCPISEKLICKTDKSGLKTELEHSIKEIKVSLSVVNKKIEMARERVKEIENSISDYNKNKENYNKKLILIKERDRLVANPIMLPEEPGKIHVKTDYTVEKAQIKEKLEILREFRAAEVEYTQTLRLKRLCAISDFIVKSLDPKGPVIREFIQTFIECLEDSCNERAKLLKTGFEVKLIPEDGLKVLFKTSATKDFLPYANLSAGEKIFAIVVLTDLINSFYDSRILILDDIDHLDAKSFKMLMDFVTGDDIGEFYDNIIISCVSHDDILEVAYDYDVDFIHMDTI